MKAASIYPLLIPCLALSATVFLVSSCSDKPEAEILLAEGKSPASPEEIPSPMREFRAAWVATVNNIDWPSSPDLTVKDQKMEAKAILDRIVALNMNAVVFQVRPQADAFYRSQIEPWSYFLTGKQGKAPKPMYDPLEFWIEEAHKRGIQLHAWFNPYRANHKSHQGEISNQSIIKQNPELVVKLGDEGYWWMVPSEEEAKKHTIKVILDVVDRYDIDGVHFDDYFYPYPSYHKNQDFPDDTSYSNYTKGGGKLDRGDWRRDSVNQLIKELAPRIKKIKPNVEFGISPFGIWRPGYPKNVKGMDQYSVLYADARLWAREGWLDYMMPQLYWPISAKNQSFTELLAWWEEQNLKKRHLWPGLSIGGVAESEKATEMTNQITSTRELTGPGTGVCLFSMRQLMDEDSAGSKALLEGPWKEPALIPSTSWLKSSPPSPPTVDLIRNQKGVLLTRFKPADESVFQFILNERKGGQWQAAKLVPGVYRSFAVKKEVEAIAVRSVDRMRNISSPVLVEITTPL